MVVSRSRCLTTVRIWVPILEHLFRSGQQIQQGIRRVARHHDSATPLCCSEQYGRRGHG